MLDHKYHCREAEALLPEVADVNLNQHIHRIHPQVGILLLEVIMQPLLQA
jgi:hypothetical protein